MGEFDKAIAAYSAAIGIDPMDPESQFYLAQCWVIKTEFEKANTLIGTLTKIMLTYPGKYEREVRAAPLAALKDMVATGLKKQSGQSGQSKNTVDKE